ncbi:Uncharacterized protein BP5553_02980 [Venustampulla echinocandica]|uniref:TAFII55 protein conserved region domain-containing protein n=1 Tax=Venustampulla echinocandica TaxID=2656787 RepID=A0A370TSX9_9HELO|nr:Uncharacterized protein BP5553_02980 [Venustampulla echinocandica]RDL38640.1 Uncharacterized protein BP5553_02980 [Venustampulla echinocandica]
MSLKLKLNVNTGVAKASSPSTPATATPGGSRPMPKLKLTNKSNPPTPTPGDEAAPKPVAKKSVKVPKPKAKPSQSRKRIKHESDDEDGGSTIAVQPPPKKVKLHLTSSQKTPVAPTPVLLKPKIKGKPPKRPLGEGYDSEASDREIDPTIEEEFVLRMFPGEDCDYLRQAISEKRIGIPVSQGGPNIQMKFFHGDGRRAAVTIRGHPYAATLVDLPCIVEGMKSWDKRGWWKTADICQMLWVFAPIKKEEEAKTIPLPKIVDPETFQYPHGLTAPMHYARKRRFRKRICRTAIEAVEEAVEKLLEADQNAQESKWEMIDPDADSRRDSQPYGEDEYSEDEDAEGEVDDTGYFNDVQPTATGIEVGDLDADLEADLEAAMEAEELEAATPMSTIGATPYMASAETPAVVDEGEDTGDESIEGEDDDDDEDEDGELDEDEKARLAQIQGTKEDIADLAKQIESVQAQLATQANPILRKRLEENARKLKAELQLKKSSIGEGEND